MKKPNLHRKDSNERHHYDLDKKQRLSIKPELLYSGTLKKSPNWSDNCHTHDFCEILFITSGKGSIIVDNKEYLIKSGNLIIYNSGCSHSEISDTSDPLEINFFGFKNIEISGLKPDCLIKNNCDCIIETGIYSDILGNYINELIIETEKQQAYYNDISKALLEIILLLILRILSYGNENYIKLNDSYIKAKKFIDENYTENITLDDVCSPLYISKYYLSHIFKEISGMPVIKYIIKMRMDKAKKLLTQTDKTINEISALVGYIDTPYFIRVFKNTEKLTPKQYRLKSKLL
jgi:AraC-like DNA-binding protein/mannose-6-phosphate isomerase-like protein (cupin superfamily)